MLLGYFLCHCPIVCVIDHSSGDTMNNEGLYVLTMKDELKRIDSILETVCGLTPGTAYFKAAREYVVARTIQNIFLTVTIPVRVEALEKIYYAVNRQYESVDNGFTFNLDQDFGSNKLFFSISSSQLAVETTIRIEGYNVLIGSSHPN